MPTSKDATLNVTDSTKHDLYTCPSGYVATVAGLKLTAASRQAVAVYLFDADAATYQVGYPTVDTDGVTLLAGLVLQQGDKIQIQAAQGGVDAVLSVSEDNGITGDVYFTFNAPAEGTAGSDLVTDAWEAPWAGTVAAVDYLPATTITGANTDTRKVALVNKGAAGAGTTACASLQFNNAVNATAHIAKAITLSVTPSDLAVAAGDVLEWQSLHVGNGMADPGGIVRLRFTRS